MMAKDQKTDVINWVYKGFNVVFYLMIYQSLTPKLFYTIPFSIFLKCVINGIKQGSKWKKLQTYKNKSKIVNDPSRVGSWGHKKLCCVKISDLTLIKNSKFTCGPFNLYMITWTIEHITAHL